MSSYMNRVAIIVLNYKGIEDTQVCLMSLSKLTYDNFTIVAVENGSHDGSAEAFKDLEQQYGEQLVVLYNDQNLGFAGGVNTGIRWAIDHDYDMVALFNNDAVADPQWLTALVKKLEDKPDLGIATGLLLHDDGQTIDSTGDWYSIWGLPFPRNRNDDASKAPDDALIFGATGGATLYRTSLFRRIGLFDEGFFAYYEDVDVSFRAQLAGYKVAYASKAIAYHKQGATSAKIPGFTVTQTFKNLPLLFWKDVPRGLLLPIGVRFFTAYFLMLGNTLKHHSVAAALKGLGQSMLLLPRALRDRRTIQRSRTVPVTYIKSLLWFDLPPDQTGLRKLRRIVTGK